MSAQQVKEMPQSQVQALIAGGKLLAANVWAVPSRGVTVTVKPGSRPGVAKVIITRGCAC